jgi:hypothetical protein
MDWQFGLANARAAATFAATMKFRTLLAAPIAALSLAAAVPPASQLFPNGTVVLLSVADWAGAKATMSAAPLGQLWADPAMRPFREDVEKKVVAKFIGDLEKDLGIKADEYLPLLQGQLSFAVIRGDGNPANPDSRAGNVLVLDAKDKAPELKAKLEEARKKLTDAKKPLKLSKIRDQDFSTVIIETKPPEGADKWDEDEKEPAKKIEITFGQVDSALVLGDSQPALEKVVARLTGGSVPTLSEVGAFQSSEAAMSFPQAVVYGWIHVAPIFDLLEGQLSKAGVGVAALGIEPRRAVEALGLRGLKSLAVAAQQNAEGARFDFGLAVPEAERAGLFKLLAVEAKECAPPPFVPADAVDFRRMRLNGPKTWANLETLLQQVSPQMGGMLQMSLGAIGKDKDTNFDFKKAFIGNLGDDFISYVKAPKGRSAEELASPPTLTLLGAVNAEELANGLKALSSLLPTGPDELKEREFNGKKITLLTLPSTDPKKKPTQLEIAPNGGYLATSDDPGLLEQFLRSSDGGGKSLRENAVMIESAQKVGGMGTGLFGFQDQRESLRGTWEAVRGGSLNKPPGSVRSPAGNAPSADEFADFKLLPPFDQVAKYFGSQVYAGVWDSQGFQLRQFGPNPR